jgi:short-subunit dehydrogenase
MQRRRERAIAFDLAIANAGVSIPSHATKFKLDEAEQTIRVNVLGLMYLYDAVIPSMVEQGSGRFVGVASIAGLRGLPTSGPYSASKAAVQAFLEAARIELKPYGVGVTIVNPGFVATPMTEKNRFRMPFLMQPGDAARVIARGIARGARVVEFPRPMSLLMRLVRYLPDALYERIMVPYARRKIDPAKVKR